MASLDGEGEEEKREENNVRQKRKSLIKSIEVLLSREPVARALLRHTTWREMDIPDLLALERNIAGVIVLNENLWP